MVTGSLDVSNICIFLIFIRKSIKIFISLLCLGNTEIMCCIGWNILTKTKTFYVTFLSWHLPENQKWGDEMKIKSVLPLCQLLGFAAGIFLYGDLFGTGHPDKCLCVYSLCTRFRSLIIPVSVSVAVSLLRGSREEAVILWLLYSGWNYFYHLV